MIETADDVIDGPAIVEMMGHRQVAGYARTVRVAGAGMIRLDTPAVAGGQPHTQYVSPGAVYDLHLVDEATMLAAAARLASRGMPAAITADAWSPAQPDGEDELTYDVDELDDDG